jgi:hypothetical protein
MAGPGGRPPADWVTPIVDPGALVHLGRRHKTLVACAPHPRQRPGVRLPDNLSRTGAFRARHRSPTSPTQGELNRKARLTENAPYKLMGSHLLPRARKTTDSYFGGRPGDSLTIARRRCISFPPPTGMYAHSHVARVHLVSGKRGMTLPIYSTWICDKAASQALCPGTMRTLRSRPSLCAFRNALSERAM